MRWHTGIQHSTKIPPKVSLIEKVNPGYPPEVKIDVRGGGIYLSLEEAQQLALDLSTIIASAPTSLEGASDE